MARRITPGLVEAADLILTATEEHRATVVRDGPLAFRKVFTLREFGRLGGGLAPLPPRADADDLIERVRLVAEQRGEVDAPLPGGDDVGDPFGAGLEVARTCVGHRTDVAGVIRRTAAVVAAPRTGRARRPTGGPTSAALRWRRSRRSTGRSAVSGGRGAGPRAASAGRRSGR